MLSEGLRENYDNFWGEAESAGTIISPGLPQEAHIAVCHAVEIWPRNYSARDQDNAVSGANY